MSADKFSGDLQGVFERVVREEAQKALQIIPPHRLSELVTDPSSGDLSMSRLAMGLLILAVLAVDGSSIYLMLNGRFSEAWFPPLSTMNTAALASVATIYTLNSAAGAIFCGARIREWGKGLLNKCGVKIPEPEVEEMPGEVAAGPGAAAPE